MQSNSSKVPLKLGGGGWISLVDAARLSGIGRGQLLRAAADSRLRLYACMSRVAGCVFLAERVELIVPKLGRERGFVMPRLGVWAAEGFEIRAENFDLSERLRLHYFGVTKGLSTPENVFLKLHFLLPPRLPGQLQRLLARLDGLLASNSGTW